MNERRLSRRGRGIWDFEVAPGVVIELAQEPHGWAFWAVNVDGERMGGHSSVPPALSAVFNTMAGEASRA